MPNLFLFRWAAPLVSLFWAHCVLAQVGQVDPAFAPTVTGVHSTPGFDILLTPQGMVIGGYITNVNGTPMSGIARLQRNGELDPSFQTGTGFTGTNSATSIWSLRMQPDGKILVGGHFLGYNGTPVRMMSRLFQDGRLDPSVNLDVREAVKRIDILPDNRIVISGAFYSVNERSSQGVALILPTGELDLTFNPPAGRFQRSVLAPSSGGIILGGANETWRLLEDGRLDPNFHTGPSSGGSVHDLIQAADGKIYVAGWFRAFDGVGQSNLVRILPDGRIDPSFNARFTYSFPSEPSSVYRLALAPDGKLYAGGIFAAREGSSARNLIRLNPDGSVDPTFDTGTGPDGPVWAIAVEPDGNVLIGGEFKSVNGQPRQGMARLYGNPHLELGRVSPEIQTITYPAVFSNWVLEASVELSATNWLNLTNLSSAVVGHDLVVTNQTSAENVFYRLVKP